MIGNNKLSILLSLALFIATLLVIYAKMDKTNLRYWYQDFTRENHPYTLLLGSSSILRMPVDLLNNCENPVVYGFNNGTTESIESYLQFAKLDNVSEVILYIGENDIARGEKPEITFSQLQTILDIFIEQTKGKIGLVKLKYSPARTNKRSEVLSFNRMLEQYMNSERIELIPFDEIKHESWFVADGIHLTSSGNNQFSKWINDFCLSE